MRSDSVAIDLCTDLGPAVDIDGEGRPWGAGMDAGGDELMLIFADGFESGDLSAWSGSV